MKRKPWTFVRLAHAAAKARDSWHLQGDEVRCDNGFCPLGAIFFGASFRLKTPAPNLLPRLMARERLAAWRMAYASDSPISPDRKLLLRVLGIRQ